MGDPMLEWLTKRNFGKSDVAGRKIVIFSNPGDGKTVLSAKLGQNNLFITNEDGYTALHNHPELDEKWRAVPFVSWNITRQILPLVESGEFVNPDNGEPFDNIIFDTFSGMVSQEIRKIVETGTTTDAGKVSAELAGRPDYFVSEQRVEDVMMDIAKLQRVSVVLNCHLRPGDKLTPGLTARPDMHAAAFKAVNKWCSVMAYLFIQDGQRKLQVMPKNGISAKTRYHFPSEIVTDDDFVAHIEKWKGNK